MEMIKPTIYVIIFLKIYYKKVSSTGPPVIISHQ
jgi:hypothetical protein